MNAHDRPTDPVRTNQQSADCREVGPTDDVHQIGPTMTETEVLSVLIANGHIEGAEVSGQDIGIIRSRRLSKGTAWD